MDESTTTEIEDNGAEGSQADYGMYSAKGNTMIDELIGEAVEQVQAGVDAGTPMNEIVAEVRSYVRETSSRIADEHPEVGDTVVQGSIVDFVVADAERLHNIVMPRFD